MVGEGSASPLGWSGGGRGGAGGAWEASRGSQPPLGSEVNLAELVEIVHLFLHLSFLPLPVPASPRRTPQQFLPERWRSHRRPISILSAEWASHGLQPSSCPDTFWVTIAPAHLEYPLLMRAPSLPFTSPFQPSSRMSPPW